MPPVPVPVPVPVPELPLMPVPLELPLMPVPLSPEVPLEVLGFLACFFLVDLFGVVEVVPWSPLVLEAPVWLLPDWELAPVWLPWSAEPLVCAWAASPPNIAATTEAPSRPFNNLFIFMSIS
jgi:signal-induced proliferation-associated 1 like protein 3